MMCSNYTPNHLAAIYKNKILHVSDDPIEITEDGDYTLLSVGSSPSQNCYYIRSHIDPTQWYVFEYLLHPFAYRPHAVVRFRIS